MKYYFLVVWSQELFQVLLWGCWAHSSLTTSVGGHSEWGTFEMCHAYFCSLCPFQLTGISVIHICFYLGFTGELCRELAKWLKKILLLSLCLYQGNYRFRDFMLPTEVFSYFRTQYRLSRGIFYNSVLWFCEMHTCVSFWRWQHYRQGSVVLTTTPSLSPLPLPSCSPAPAPTPAPLQNCSQELLLSTVFFVSPLFPAPCSWLLFSVNPYGNIYDVDYLWWGSPGFSPLFLNLWLI